MLMEVIKLFVKKWKKKLETLIQRIRIYRQDIGMECGIENCAMLIIIKSEKRQITEGIELQNQERIRILGEKETSKYLGIFKVDMKSGYERKKMKKEYLRRTRKLLETKLCSRNLMKEINTWAVPHVRYTELFLEWTREEL